MTTTLRPAGPEETLPDGGRARRWHVCANGRPVGTVRTLARPRGGATSRPAAGGGWAGQIEELEIAPAGRRRGRGTVAALAAEEVLRAWGCDRCEVTVPVTAPHALALAGVLGYTETNRKLTKRIGQPPSPTPGLTTRPIGPADFPGWLERTKETYRRHLVGSGLTEQQAWEVCEEEHTHLLVDGHATEGVVLRHLLRGGEPIGYLWLALRDIRLPDGRPLAWVMTVEVDGAHRGHGYGRELMLTAERACLEAGVHDLGLNVYSANHVAIALYDSLGYTVSRRVLAKSLL